MQEPNQDKIWRHFQGEGRRSFVSSHPRLRYLAARVKKWVGQKRVARGAARVLNIGVGDGYFEEQALKAGLEVYSVDPDAGAVAQVTEQGARGAIGVIESLPFESEYFDVVTASEVLEHLGSEQRSLGLAEISRVLNPGGLFIGTVPYAEDLSLNETVCPCCGMVFHRWGHQASFTLESMRHELESCFVVQELRRTAFVSYIDRGLGGKVKAVFRVMLAKFGQQIASPNILFLATRKL